MSVILFYTPFRRRSRDVESLMLQFKQQGHKVISLSQAPGVDINPFLKSQGIDAYSHEVQGKVNFVYYLKHLIYFISFCYKHKVNVVFSHLDPANFVASIGQYFIRGTVYLCRHHIDEAALYNYNRSWTYKLTNFLAKKIIVVSKRAEDYAITEEKVAPAKLIHINLAYDFSLYNYPDATEVVGVRKKYNDPELLLLTVSRLTEFKRPELSIEVLQNLRKKGIAAKLVILGDGPTRKELDAYISENGLADCVFLEGHVKNVMAYLTASDFVLHPSVLESSCVVIKEAGIVKKPVIVCKGIGDFDEFIQHAHNGFLVDRNRFVAEAEEIIRKNARNTELLSVIGENLSKDISTRFDIKNIIEKYIPLIGK